MSSAEPTGPSESFPLPGWALELRRRYLSGESSIFLLHGAGVEDLVRWGEEYIPLRDFLQRFFARTRDYTLVYDHSQGLRVADTTAREAFVDLINASRTMRGDLSRLGLLPRDPSEALTLVEEALLLPNTRGAVIFQYAETIVPDSRLNFMSSDDRTNLVRLQRWTSDPRVLRADNLVVMITEQLSEIHQKLVSSPQLSILEVKLPDEEERLHYLGYLARRYSKAEPTPQELAPITAGLSRLHLEGIYREAFQSGIPVDYNLIRLRKKEIIEHECFGLIEIVETRHDFTHVGGMEEVKKVLTHVAAAIRDGHRSKVPMGVLLVGPMGTGKSFLAEAFAKTSGLTCLKLKNFRGSLVGETEANLERVLGVVKAMGYVLVIIDEGDRSIGGGGGSKENDGGVDSRVIARLKEFMSDTTHRGRILFMMMTNRPDKLDADMKRPGRFDLKIPFFAPDSAEERERIFKSLCAKNRINHEIEDFSLAVSAAAGYTGAEIEAVLLTAVSIADENGHAKVTSDDLMAALQDFIPSRDSATIEMMEMLAVFECSSRRLLPPRFRELTSEEVNSRLREVRRHLLTA